MNKFLIALISLSLALPCVGKNVSYDVIVAGAGTGGFGAAVQAARQGCNVLLLEESDYLGGQMAAAGVGTMDEGTPRIRENGIYKEFCSRVSEYYSSIGLINNLCYWATNSFSVEPHVAQKVIYDMIAEVNANKQNKGRVTLMLLSKVTKVNKEGNKVTGVSVQTGLDKKVEQNFDCKVLIDATEYGDVIPLTGARYFIAKHTSDNVNPQSNVQMNTWTAILKEYPDGIPDYLKVKEKPKGYEKSFGHYSFIKLYADDPYNVYANPTSWNTVAYYRGMPDSGRPGINNKTVKTELNIAQNDVAVKVRDCIDPEARFAKEMELRSKTLGLIYYLQNELGLSWALDPAEGYDTPYNCANIDKMIALDPSYAPFKEILVHFPVLPYVRESYRIIGQHVLVSGEIDRIKGPHKFADALCVNDYPEDLHGSRRPEDLDLDIDPTAIKKQEITNWSAHCGEFQVPMGSFIPETLDGFLVAEKNLSQSRLANGATRLQPSTMNNGQAAGNIAALCVKYNCQPRQLPAILVQWEQVKAKSPLWFKQISDVPIESNLWNYVQMALQKGYFKLEYGRFFPENLVEPKEMDYILQKSGLVGLISPETKITRNQFIKKVIDAELGNSKKNLI